MTNSPSPSVDEVGFTDAQVDAAQTVLEQWGLVNGSRTAARLALHAASLVSPPKAGTGEPVAWACVKCNSPRSIDPCPKCGTSLTKPAEGWEWPRLPDIDRIRALARDVGYAIGIHGTQERDLDLIAAPWVADAVAPMALAEHIANGLGGSVLDYKTQDKPCGRWSCNINADGWFKLIDLSVMPPVTSDVVALSLALKPFADMAGDYDPEEGDDDQAAWLEYPKVGWLRKARSAMASRAPNHEARGDGVRVKPLEWYDGANGSGVWSRDGGYNIGRGRGAYLCVGPTMDRGGRWTADVGRFETADEAKAAAQLDYETRIRRTLLPPLGDGGAEIVEALLWAMDEIDVLP